MRTPPPPARRYDAFTAAGPIDEHQVLQGNPAVRAGVGLTIISRWWGNRMPTVHNLQAALNVLGYTLYLKPIAGTRRGLADQVINSSSFKACQSAARRVFADLAA